MKKTAPPRIVVVGSSNTDLVVRCPRLPRPGETQLGGEFARYAGGKGANQAVAAARAGARVSFVGRHGRDEFGATAKDGLKREGIDVRHFRACADAPSGIALILLGGKTRENLIAVAASANDRVAPNDVRAAESAIAGASVVVAQLEVPIEAVAEAAAIAARHGVPFVLNPAPAAKLPPRLLRLVHTITPNEAEAAALTGARDFRIAARALRAKRCANVVVTLGAKGAWVCTVDGEWLVRAPRVRPVDTVGAGDCFTAWLAVGIGEGRPMRDAVAHAVRAASLAVTRPGAQAGMPRRGEVA